ncbi:MAG: hypothetical protein ACK6DQ_20915, partial [Planctomycetota bacterium]
MASFLSVQTGLLLAVLAFVCPQDAAKEPADKADAAGKIDKAIRKVHEDYDDYLAQKKKLVESYESLQASIKQSEDEWSRIQNEGVIKQFSAIQSAMNSMQISNT